MLLNHKRIDIDGCEYSVCVAPIIKGETKVMFSRPNFLTSAIIRIEDDEVVKNTGLSDSEIEAIKTWISKHRLELWKEAQNTPLPSNEQLNKLADNAIKEINNIAMRDPITANKIRNEILGAIEEELNNRKNDTDTSLPF